MNFSIFGLGNVGSNVYNILKKNNKIFTFSKNNRFKCLLKNNTKNYKDIFKKKILFIELIGNTNFTIEIIFNCIKNKNNLISANKDLLAKYFFFINFLFKKNKIVFFYEASVCGSLPILNLLDIHYSKEKIYYSLGILNGTCNYILTNLKKINFFNLIKLSIKKGFAEKKYKNDLLGLDSNFKSSIIFSKIFNNFIFFYNIYLESLFNITKYLKKIFYFLKFLSYSLNINNFLFLNISLFLSKNTLLKKCINSFNSIIFNCFNSKKTFLIGIGAGGIPTASSVESDYYKSFKKFFLKEKKCFIIKNIIKNSFFFNFVIKIRFNYNIFFFIKLFKIKILKFFFKKKIIIKTKKTFYKKILFFLFFFKKKFFINKYI